MASSHHPLPPMPPPPTPPARPRRRRRSRALIIALIALALSANGIEAAAPVRYNTNAPSTSYLPPTPPRKRDSYLPPPGRVQRGKRPPAQPTTDPIYFSSSHGSFPFSEQAGRAGGAGAAGANGKGKVKGKGKAKAAAAEQAPEARPDAFPYLSDIGLRHKVPFKSGMPQAGASWAEAGLRPNVDPKMPSEHRPERKAPSRKAGGSGGVKGGGGGGGRVGEAGNEGDAGPSWTLAPEDPSRSSSSDADAAALAEEWSHQPGQPSSPISTTTSASSPFSSNHPPTPALLRLGSHLLSSSKQVWKWLASTKADHHDGIALTMLKPKVHRPVVAHLPLIPNDSKRDLVALIVGTLCIFALGTMLWNSRVSQEEFVRLKRLKELGGADGSAARSPEVLATLGPGEQDRYGAASAAYSSSAGRRRRRVAKQQGSEGYDVAGGGSGDESDGDATLMGGAPGWAATGRRPKPVSRSSADPIGGGSTRPRGSSGGFFGGWLGGWNRSRGPSRSDGAIALPLLGGGGGDASSSSRSSTPRAPHFLFEDHDYDSAGSGGLASASVATPTAGRRWGLPTPSSIQSALVAATAPSTPASELPATATTSEGSSSFFASRPFRSLTPQPPQTQRQRERDRSRERRRRAREEREQQQQYRPASDQAALAAELEDGTIGDDVLAGLPLRSASANSHRSWAAAALRWGGGSGEASGSSSASASASNSIDGLASISAGTYQADGGWRHVGGSSNGAEGSVSGSSSRVGTPRLSSAEQMKRPGFRWAATNDEQAGGGGHDGVVGGGAPSHAGEWDHQHQGSEGHATAARWKGKGRDV